MVCPFNLELPSFLYFKKIFWICLNFFPILFCSSVQDTNLCMSASFTSVCFVLSVITFSSLFLSILDDFLSLACAFNSTYLFSVASELTFISIIALFFYLLFIFWALPVYFSTSFLLISFLIPYFFFELFCKTMLLIHLRLKSLVSLFSGMDYLWSIFFLICHRHLFIFLFPPPPCNMLGPSQPDSFCGIISIWTGASSCMTNNCAEEAERLA